jgi:hypothetical protein
MDPARLDGAIGSGAGTSINLTLFYLICVNFFLKKLGCHFAGFLFKVELFSYQNVFANSLGVGLMFTMGK